MYGAQLTNSFFTANEAVSNLDLQHLAVKIVFANFHEKKDEKKPIMTKNEDG